VAPLKRRFPAARTDRPMPQATPPKEGAICYYRVSTVGQLDNLSIETQQKACRDHCARAGLPILEEFQDAASAKTTERPQFQAMLEYCRKNHRHIGAVVVYSVSRFARNMTDHLAVRTSLRANEIRLISTTEAFDDSSSGKMLEGMMGLLAEWDNNVRSERTIAGMTTAIRAGKWCHKAPVGYLNDASLPGGLRIDPDRAAAIKQAFELFDSGYSKVEILQKMHALGLTISGSGKKITAQTLDKLLRNPTYAGWVISSWGITARGQFEPIVEDQVFQRVEARLAVKHGGQQAVRSPQNKDFPLRVFIKCGSCGKGLTGSFATGRRGKKYAHYFCRTSKCRAVKFRREDLHALFGGLLQSLVPKEGFIPLFQDVVKDVWRQRNAQQEAQRAEKLRLREKLESRRQRLVDLLVEGALRKPEYDDQIEKVGTQLKALGSELENSADSIEELDILLQFADWLLQRVAGIWNAAELGNKQRLQHVLFPDGLTVSSKAFGTPKHPLFFDTYSMDAHANYGLASPGGFEPPLPP
jgi:site-specific DNA recombinase